MRLTESEIAAIVPLVFAAAAMIAGWLADTAGLPIVPAAVLAFALLSTGVVFAATARRRGAWMLSFAPGRFAAFLLVVVLLATYILWLAWPSFFPITEGPDIVHHLSLIHFIQRRHALPDDPALGAYLGEMASYTPGSHLVAALFADAAAADAIRFVHPVQAVAVGLQAGLVFNTLARLGVRAGFGAPSAVAGALLLLLPHRYLLEPVTVFGFYSQVMAQTFAVAMLWAMVAWHQEPSRRLLALAGVFGVGVVLCWPVYFPAASLAVGIGIAVAYLRGERRLRKAIVDLLIALGPAAMTIAIFSAGHVSSAGILRSGGAVLVPSVQAFGWPFLLISAAGVAVALRHARTTAPLRAFAATCGLQIVALAVVQSLLGATNRYLANKTVFLLVVPLAVMGGFALGMIGGRAAEAQRKFRPTPGVARNLSSASQPQLPPPLFTWAPPVIVAVLLACSGLPLRPLDSPITEPVYRAGLWAKAHVPASCVEYFVDHWITGYWLHLDVLGNARASERMRTETFDYRNAVSRWILPGGLPFAVVENLEAVPRDARANMDVLFQAGRAAVVRRADRRGACTDSPPIDRVANNPRARRARP